MELSSATSAAASWHASTHASSHSSSSLEEHLENVVGVHATHSTTLAALINLLDVCSFVVHLSLLRVRKHGVGLANVLEFGFSLLLLLLGPLSVLVGVPLNCCFAIGFLYFAVTSSLVNSENRVVVFALGLFNFELGLPQLFAETLRLRSHLLELIVLLEGLFPFLFVHLYVSLLHVSLPILLVQGNGRVAVSQSFLELL